MNQSDSSFAFNTSTIFPADNVRQNITNQKMIDENNFTEIFLLIRSISFKFHISLKALPPHFTDTPLLLESSKSLEMIPALPQPKEEKCLNEFEEVRKITLCFLYNNIKKNPFVSVNSYTKLKIMIQASLLTHFLRKVSSLMVITETSELYTPIIEYGVEKIHLLPNWQSNIAQPNSYLANNKPQHFVSMGAFRTCFKLDVIEEKKNSWVLSLQIQSVIDPSLILNVKDLFNATNSSNFLHYLLGFTNQLFSILSADLAKVEQVFKPFHNFSINKSRFFISLTNGQAYQFLKQTSVLLQTRGYGILVPSWWGQSRDHFTLHMSLAPCAGDSSSMAINSGLFNLERLVEYDWSLALESTILTIEEISQLARIKIPLIQVRGRWVEFDSRELGRILRVLHLSSIGGKQSNHQKSHVMPLKDAIQIFSISQNNPTFHTEFDVSSKNGLDKVVGMLNKSIPFEPLATPDNFQGILRPYQITGLSWMNYLQSLHMGCCLADDMGLGKTIQVIALLLNAKQNNTVSIEELQEYQKPKRSINKNKNCLKDPSEMKCSLIVCPLSVVGNWANELQKFAPNLTFHIHHGENRLNRNTIHQMRTSVDIIITTYNLIIKDKALFAAKDWQYLVLDEAQNIKNPNAKQTRAIKDLRAEHRIALTGTPIENHLQELWSIMDFLNPGYLGTLSQFHEIFARPIEINHDENQIQILQQLISPLILRRLKTDPNLIPDLPSKTEMKIYTHLTPEQASLYEAEVQLMLDQIEDTDGIQRKGLILATLTKLKQICNHPMQFLHERNPATLNQIETPNNTLIAFDQRSGKVKRMIEMLQNILEGNEKVLIFTQYREMGFLLQTFLQSILNREILFLSGATSQEMRQEMIQRFQSPNGPAIFILSLKAGGLGLTLTAANHVIHFDRWWNPAVENQATDRVYRIGQTKPVIAYKFLCPGTLEEKIDLLIDQKKDLATKILTTGDSWITELSTERLRDLFTLRRECIEDTFIESSLQNQRNSIEIFAP